MKEGDKLRINGREYAVLAPLCYQGKEGCESAMCTRIGWNPETGDMGRCVGYHCATCDEPCGPQGHRCPEAAA